MLGPGQPRPSRILGLPCPGPRGGGHVETEGQCGDNWESGRTPKGVTRQGTGECSRSFGSPLPDGNIT